MDQHPFTALTRTLTSLPSRRDMLHGLAGAGLGLGALRLPDVVAAKSKKKKKTRVCVCQGADATTCTGQKKAKTQAKKILKGNPCAYQGTCQAGVSGCSATAQPLTDSAPSTISACWTADRDHDTYLFVPQAGSTTDPNPYIDWGCHPSNSQCTTSYPFACVDQNARHGGCEVTTVHRVLAGTYEYWMRLYIGSLAEEVMVTLRNSGGGVLATFSSPANPSNDVIGWHVFDVVDGVIITSDHTVGGSMPASAHDPNTYVCP